MSDEAKRIESMKELQDRLAEITRQYDTENPKSFLLPVLKNHGTDREQKGVEKPTKKVFRF